VLSLKLLKTKSVIITASKGTLLKNSENKIGTAIK
jgi:hypothetical protein